MHRSYESCFTLRSTIQISIFETRIVTVVLQNHTQSHGILLNARCFKRYLLTSARFEVHTLVCKDVCNALMNTFQNAMTYLQSTASSLMAEYPIESMYSYTVMHNKSTFLLVHEESCRSTSFLMHVGWSKLRLQSWKRLSWNTRHTPKPPVQCFALGAAAVVCWASPKLWTPSTCSVKRWTERMLLRSKSKFVQVTRCLNTQYLCAWATAVERYWYSICSCGSLH